MRPIPEQIIINEEYAEATVWGHFPNKRHSNTYLVKVSFTDIGFYINGITVDPSRYPKKGLWVQLPRYKAAGKWRWPIEAKRSSPLFCLIEKLARQAVDDYIVANPVFTDEDMERAITLDDLDLPKEFSG